MDLTEEIMAGLRERAEKVYPAAKGWEAYHRDAYVSAAWGRLVEALVKAATKKG